MTAASTHLLKAFPVRKTAAQKADFRAWLKGELTALGYPVKEEAHKGPVLSVNVVAGELSAASLVVTAHYDTCAVMPFPNFITPRTLWAFLLFQLLTAAAAVAVMFGTAAGLAALGLPGLPSTVVGYVLMIFLLWWMLAGKANRSNVNDNTSGVITLLEIAAALPEQLRDRVAFVFFDNEEKGLLGSSGFHRLHRAEMEDKLLLNFDCVSDGDHILFIPNRKLRGEAPVLDRLTAAFPSCGSKRVEVCREGFMIYPSDQRHFPRGVGVAACHDSKLVGPWLGRIHTGRDRVLMEENIELLRRGVEALLQG